MIKCHLSRIMGEKRLKIADIARETGINRGTITRLYYEQSERIDMEVLDALCSYLDCSVADLLEYQVNGNLLHTYFPGAYGEPMEIKLTINDVEESLQRRGIFELPAVGKKFIDLVGYIKGHKERDKNLPLIFPDLEKTFGPNFIKAMLGISQFFYKDTKPKGLTKKKIQLGLLHFILPRLHSNFAIMEGTDIKLFEEKLLKSIDTAFENFCSSLLNDLSPPLNIKNEGLLDLLDFLIFEDFTTLPSFGEFNSKQFQLIRTKIAEINAQADAPLIFKKLETESIRWHEIKLDLEDDPNNGLRPF